jgi:Tfp pilus assembly protein PilN
LNIKLLNNISLLRLTGISKFICIDVHSDYIKFSYIKRKEPFYSIFKNDSIANLEIIGTEYKRGHDLNIIIEKTLKDIILKYSFNNAALILGINDFRFSTVSIPSDIEDVDLWFSENRNKFLPEGRPLDDFEYAYELYKEDENYKQFYVILVRNDFINPIIKSSMLSGSRIIGILPFALTLFSNEKIKDKNTLFLDFEEEKISFSYKSESGNILYRDLFFEIYAPAAEENLPSEFRKINLNNLNFCVEEIKQILTLSFGSQFSENLDILLSSHPNHYEIIYKQIKDLIKPENINAFLNKETQFYSSSLFVVNKMLNDFDTKLNIFKNDEYDKERFLIEKQTNLRITLVAGIVLLFFLLSTFLLENYLTDRIDTKEDNFIELTAKAENIKKLKIENTFLKANIDLLNKLKGNRVEYSKLLLDVTKLINSNCCLTGFNLKQNNEFILVDFAGLAYSQEDVAEFMSNMEYSKKFKETTLIYSSINKEDKYNSVSNFSENDYIKFNITAKYYVD